MSYVALEWDHKCGKSFIKWIVVECAGLGWKAGGPQALAPRRDVAYFVDDTTAERDAKAFADHKNGTYSSPAEQRQWDATGDGDQPAPRRHVAFEWDHELFKPLIRWAVLQWSGDPNRAGPRDDVAYFVDAATAERDAKGFSRYRDSVEDATRASALLPPAGAVR